MVPPPVRRRAARLQLGPPRVAASSASILRFWLDLGVDGFRVDVAHGLVKAAGLPDVGHADQVRLLGTEVLPFFDQDGVHEIYRAWRTLLDEYPGRADRRRRGLGADLAAAADYVRPDEMHQAFNFQFLRTPWDAAALREVITGVAGRGRAVGAARHLGAVQPRRHPARHPASPAPPWTAAAPRPRAAGRPRARAAARPRGDPVMLALPGSAYLYQGEELGLPDVTDLPDEARQDPSYLRAAGQDGCRDGCRVPIPWAGDAPSVGFGPRRRAGCRSRPAGAR